MIELTIHHLAERIMAYFDIPVEVLKTPGKGRDGSHIARPFTVYLARYHCGIDLNTIAEYFDIGHYASVSKMAIQFKQKLNNKQDRKSVV